MNTTNNEQRDLALSLLNNKEVPSFTPIKKEEGKKHIEPNEGSIRINIHKHGHSPYIKDTISIEEVLMKIKNGNGNVDLINEAREVGKGTDRYESIKMRELPSVSFNFNFYGKIAKDNIKASTGLIYIDIDGVEVLDNTNPLIYASWKSLSNTGFGLLVKVEGLTPDNFQHNYREVTKALGVESDPGANKGTQQNILSYDRNIYMNTSSTIYKATNESPSLGSIKKKEKGRKHIGLNEGGFEEYTGKVRFSNINEYFDNDDETKFKVFENKEGIIMPFIPKSTVGTRSYNMFSYLSQVALLNPETGFKFLKSVADTFNTRCFPNLAEDKVQAIVNNVIKKRKAGELIANKNQDRRVIFNPNTQMTKKEKQSISAVEVGRIRTAKTNSEIADVIADWDFETNGLISQSKVAKVSGKSKATIERRWSEFKAYVEEQNQDYKNNK